VKSTSILIGYYKYRYDFVPLETLRPVCVLRAQIIATLDLTGEFCHSQSGGCDGP
jgi:hypothetical protein